MALLSGMIRSATVTGRTDYINAWFGGRQGGRWAEQTVRRALPITPESRRPRAAAPAPAPASAAGPADPAAALKALADLQASGAITAAELKTLRSRLGV
jgi:hypothetical protein